MSATARIRSLADIEAIERTPYPQQPVPGNIYEALVAGAAINPDRAALKFLREGSAAEEPVTVTYRQLLGRIHQSANLFHRFGIGPTDTVSYLLPLLPQTYFVLCGAEVAGIACSVNPLLEPAQIAEILRAARTKVLVTLGPQPTPGLWEKVDAIRRQLPQLSAIFQVGNPALGEADAGQGIYSYDAWVEKMPADRLLTGRTIAPGDIASYFHTGGTTGAPKLARHTHAGQAYICWVLKVGGLWNSEDTVAAGLPMFHIAGAVAALAQFANGMSIVVLSPAGYRNPNVIRDHWKIVRRYGVTAVFTVPTGWSALLNVPVEPGDLATLRSILSAASPLPPEVARAVERQTGLKMQEVYGMTETTGAWVGTPSGGEARYGSVGLRYPFSKMRIVKLDASGRVERDCARDEIGVIAVKGPGVFPGYVEERHNKDLFLDDGWLNTGDLGRMDGAGYLWLAGRAKDLIIRGGHNIDPQMIEDTLHRHPDVLLAAAIGKPDVYAGELPVAYVQLKPGAAANAADLQAYAQEHIAERAAAPVELHLIESMPQTAVGKIFKPQLRWDATRRVYSEVLRQAGLEGFRVEVGSDPTHGTLATVHLSAVSSERPALERQVRECLGGFATAHRVAWS